jgi:transposase
LPRVKRLDNKLITIVPPWSTKNSRCTNQFESKVIDMLHGTLNQTKTAILMNCSFNQVNRIMHRSVERGLALRPKDVAFSNLSIDEKAFKRNHNYVEVLSLPLSGVVIDVCQDRTKEATKALLSKVILEENRDAVEIISVDM